ncbi:MAG TPA: hypothetical protein VHW06_10135 [Streptosporangiaceae bacterium]|nr:hypothetical protein [Streptosporangiaceae bacterium]
MDTKERIDPILTRLSLQPNLERYLAGRARNAGVDVILDVTADVPHVFQTFARTLDEAGQALDRAALFLQQHIAADPAGA